jgi:hypothetical protein
MEYHISYFDNIMLLALSISLFIRNFPVNFYDKVFLFFSIYLPTLLFFSILYYFGVELRIYR